MDGSHFIHKCFLLIVFWADRLGRTWTGGCYGARARGVGGGDEGVRDEAASIFVELGEVEERGEGVADVLCPLFADTLRLALCLDNNGKGKALRAM